MPLLCQQTWPVSNLAQPGENVAGPALQVNVVKQREYQILESLREIKFNAQSIAWTLRDMLFQGLLSIMTRKAFVVLHAVGDFRAKVFSCLSCSCIVPTRGV